LSFPFSESIVQHNKNQLLKAIPPTAAAQQSPLPTSPADTVREKEPPSQETAFTFAAPPSHAEAMKLMRIEADHQLTATAEKAALSQYAQVMTDKASAHEKQLHDMHVKYQSEAQAHTLLHQSHNLLQVAHEEYREGADAKIKSLEMQLDQEIEARHKAEVEREAFATRLVLLQSDLRTATDRVEQKLRSETDSKAALKADLDLVTERLNRLTGDHQRQVDSLQADLLHQQNVNRSEKELAAKMLADKVHEFDREQKRMQANAASKYDTVEQSLRSSEEARIRAEHELSEARQQILQMRLDHESKCSQLESQLRTEQVRTTVGHRVCVFVCSPKTMW
jgi:hypothetical protein